MNSQVLADHYAGKHAILNLGSNWKEEIVEFRKVCSRCELLHAKTERYALSTKYDG